MTGAVTRTGKRRLSYERKKSRVGLYFLIPWIIGFLLFFLIPAIGSLTYSVGKIDAETGFGIQFVGFEHYIKAFTEDSQFVPLLLNSIPPMVYQVPIIVIFSLFLALIINQKFFGRTFARAVFFLPIVIASGMVISIIRGDAFSQMLMQNTSSSHLFQSEMLSILLKEMEIAPEVVSFITKMVDSIFELIWKSGIQTLLFLAALQTISPSMYEAAKMEGGTAWENFWKITFPMVSPTILINLIYSIIDNFSDYSNQVVTYINSFSQQAMFEYSSALTWVYALLMLAFVALVYVVVNRFVYYEG